jgi:hypothetical protein
VATAVADSLRKTVPTGSGGDFIGLRLPKEGDADEVSEIVRASVGYRPRTEGFKRGEG